MASASSSSFRDGISDADIEAQAQALRAEVESSQPLVGDEELPASLAPAYADNPTFLPKIAELSRKYRAIRRSRGDGSCFYRCFMIGLGEAFVRARVVLPGTKGAVRSRLQDTYEAVLRHAEGSLEMLIALGYPESTVPDFHEAFLDFLRGLAAPGASAEASVYAPFRDHMGGFYILTYLRLLVSLELLAQEETYLPYVLGLAPHCATVKHVRAGGVGSEGVWEQPRPCPPVQFCETEVEAVHRDADQVQVVALTAALKVGIRIAYLDASAGALSEMTFPEDAAAPGPDDASAAAGTAADATATTQILPPPLLVYLLYRPGHYDVAYPATG